MCSTGSRPQLADKDEYRTSLYFPVLDRMINELNVHFSDLNKSLMKALQACTPSSPSFFDFSTLKPILDTYNVDEPAIHIELIQAKKMSEVIDILQPLKAAFPGVLQVLQIALTFAVTTASCE